MEGGITSFIPLLLLFGLLWLLFKEKTPTDGAHKGGTPRKIVAAALINCPVCENTVSDQASSCPKCGHPIRSTPTIATAAAPLKSRSLAVFLALILGGIGVHKFYVDKPGVGLCYLLFCWTFIPSLFGLIEAIQYVSMTDDVFQEKYIKKKL